MRSTLATFVVTCMVISVQGKPQLPFLRQGDCDSMGGTCQDFRGQYCKAGYQKGLCAGDCYTRCCLPCDQTCEDNHAQWEQNDGNCAASGGVCQMNSNLCEGGFYTSGKCGGPSDRQCCQPLPTSCPKITSREEWCARDPRSISYANNNQYQFVHHADTPDCNNFDECAARLRSIQDYHMDDPDHLWSDIGYSFLVGGDGQLYQGRGFGVIGAHTGGFNSVGHGTCFIGTFDDTAPTPSAQDTYLQFLQCSVDLGYTIPDFELYGHRQAGSTTCPGDALYGIIQSWPGWTDGSPSRGCE